MSAMMTQLLSSGEICKLRYDNIPVKNASANVSFYTNNSKMPSFEFWHSCHKWAIYCSHQVEGIKRKTDWNFICRYFKRLHPL